MSLRKHLSPKGVKIAHENLSVLFLETPLFRHRRRKQATSERCNLGNASSATDKEERSFRQSLRPPFSSQFSFPNFSFSSYPSANAILKLINAAEGKGGGENCFSPPSQCKQGFFSLTATEEFTFSRSLPPVMFSARHQSKGSLCENKIFLSKKPNRMFGAD